MPGPTPANYPFPETPKSFTFQAWFRWAVAVKQWASQFVIDLDPPSAIPSATATANNLAVVLSWEPAKKASQYRIHRGTTGDYSASSVIAEVPASKTKVAVYTWQDSQDQTTPTRYYWITPLNERGIEGPKTAMLQVSNFNAIAGSTAAGINAQATGDNSVAIGTDALASGDNAVAVGKDTVASGDDSTALGYSAEASADSAVALGANAEASGTDAIAVGTDATADVEGLAFGTRATAYIQSIAMGRDATADGIGEIVLGAGAAFSGDGSIGIGEAVADNGFDQCIVLGNNASADKDRQFVEGSAVSWIVDRKTVVGENHEAYTVKTLTELLTITAGAFTDTAIQIPAQTTVKAVPVRTVTTIPTATTYTVTGASSGTVFSAGPTVGTTIGATDKGNAAGPHFDLAGEAIRITPDLVPLAATGQVRVTIIYEDITPPTT